MKIFIRLHILFLFLSVFFIGCKQEKPLYTCPTGSTLDLDISNSEWYASTMGEDSVFQLYRLQDSGVAPAIRIAFHFDSIYSKVNFKLDLNNSTFDMYVLKVEDGRFLVFDKNLGLEKYKISYTSVEKSRQFRSLLRNKEIFKLPDASKIPGYVFPGFELTTIEIKTPCLYKFLSYDLVESRAVQFSEAAKVWEVEQFLKQIIYEAMKKNKDD